MLEYWNIGMLEYWNTDNTDRTDFHGARSVPIRLISAISGLRT